MINVNEYAKALFLLAEEDGSTDVALSDVKMIKRLLAENPDYKNLLDTPALPKQEKLALIDEAFSGIHENTKNLLKILCERHGIYSFPKIADAFALLYDESRKIERVEAVSAIELTDAQLDALREKLQALTGKTIIINNTVDPSIIGGMKLRYSGKQLDGSLKTRLESFEQTLRTTVI